MNVWKSNRISIGGVRAILSGGLICCIFLLMPTPGVQAQTTQTESYDSSASKTVEPTAYKYVEETVFVKQPVTKTKWVEETVYEKKQKKTYKHVWNTEQREKKTTVKKPVTKTVMKEERTVLRKPITETKYREKRTEYTDYETVQELREENVTVRKPVIETEYRDENYTVRKKVTENVVEVQNVTQYKAVNVPQTTLVPTQVPGAAIQAVPDLNARSRLRFLRPGYYTDPLTGQAVYRGIGLHWVQPQTVVAVPTTETAYVPQVTQGMAYVPETVERRRPIEISKWVDQVETRKVPVEVQRMVEETVTRRVPVNVQKPVTRYKVEKIPYTETRYVDEVVVNKIPVEVTTYEEVTEIEPYEIEVSRWVPTFEEVEVPKTVRKKVEYEEQEEVPQKVYRKVPVDDCGNAIGPGERITKEQFENQGAAPRHSSGFGTTEGQSETTTTRYFGTWESPGNEAGSDKVKSMMVPESDERNAANPSTQLSPLDRLRSSSRFDSDADRNSEVEAADQVPALESSMSTKRPATELKGPESQDISDIANLETRRRPLAE